MRNIKSLLFLALLFLVSFAATAQVPVFDSYPPTAASPVRPTIFLDFDGQTVSGTQWNNTAGTINAGPANLSTEKITEIFNRIAEDYRPFNINVTTDSTKYFGAPAKKRIRVILTSSHTWYSQPVGGVAYTGSFTWGDNTPCWVFTTALGDNVKKISEAGAHEAGHTLGLRHQASYDASCVKISDYNAGTGTGEIGWAPIMGVGYSKNFTTWHLGPTSVGCTTSQSDLGMITRPNANGVTYRTDDYTDGFLGATTAAVTNNEFEVSGVIAQSEDKDMFQFQVTNPGRFRLTAVPYSVGTNNSGSDLDLQVQLFDANKVQVGSYNPEPLLSSVIDTALAAGTYYLLVDGKGNQFATEYGSLGSYALEGTIEDFRVLPLHKLELKGVNQAGLHQFNWEIVADEAITKQVLEASSNGRNFSPVTEMSISGRAHSYYPNASGTLQYRLNVTFDNGRQYYSNIIVLRPAASAAQKPQLVTNIIRANTLLVMSQGSFRYSVADFSGRVIEEGNITEGTNTLPLFMLSGGAYTIRFSNGSEQFVEKFIKP
ncbi:MAG: hypothetical protein JWP69_323 [Flaviaesturariibacter sp.]|nr:hypothetical protein [Flaviaesturariibacter sp.]